MEGGEIIVTAFRKQENGMILRACGLTGAARCSARKALVCSRDPKQSSGEEQQGRAELPRPTWHSSICAVAALGKFKELNLCDR